MPAGYYGNIDISTTFDPPGTVKYSIGHHHYGSNGKGCYTKKNTSSTTVTCSGYAGREDWGGYDEITGERHHFWFYDCPHGYSADGDRGQYVSVTHQLSSTTYSLGCGKSEGEFVRETEDVSQLADNEKIVSATITY